MTFFLRKKGEIFGYAEMILEQNRTRSAQCLDDCLIWVLNANIFLREIFKNPDMMKEILKITNARLLQQQRTVERLIAQPASWRLAWLLKELSVSSEKKSFIINESLTHAELSNIIGCSRQTITEILTKWRKLGYITYDRKLIKVKDMEQIFNS